MGHTYRVYRCRVKEQLVFIVYIAALLQAAVDENILAAGGQTVAAAGHYPGRPPKAQFHKCASPFDFLFPVYHTPPKKERGQQGGGGRLPQILHSVHGAGAAQPRALRARSRPFGPVWAGLCPARLRRLGLCRQFLPKPQKAAPAQGAAFSFTALCSRDRYPHSARPSSGSPWEWYPAG